MRIDFRTRKTMGFGGQGGMYVLPKTGPDGVCKMPTCGWHAELGVDGYCKTRECRETRWKSAKAEFSVNDGKGNVTRYIVR